MNDALQTGFPLTKRAARLTRDAKQATLALFCYAKPNMLRSEVSSAAHNVHHPS